MRSMATADFSRNYMLRELRKHSDKGLMRALVLSVALLMALLSHSCRNPGAFTVTGRTEIQRFMAQNEDIGELFDFDVYATDTFTLDSGAATFRVARITEKAMGDVGISVSKSSLTNSFGTAPLAIATRTDSYQGTFGQRSSLTGSEIETPYDTRLRRRALFMKLGTDDDRFFGWEFIGFDLGKPLSSISELVTITQIPRQIGFPTVLSEQAQEADLSGEYRFFTFFFHIKSVKAGDSIDIQTKRGPMTIFARTNTGHRQLSGRHIPSEPPGVFHYGYRIPPADPQNRFYHLITFQRGPEVVIDSTVYNRFITALIEKPLIPPDTQLTNIPVMDTTIDSLFLFIDTCVDTFLNDTTALDSCGIREFDVLDTVVNISFVVDTTIITTTTDTIFDSVLAPDTSTRLEDLWVFPYSVR